MKISIIVDDQTVVCDGVGASNIDMTGVPADVWAMQLDGSKGHIELRDHSNHDIDALPKWAVKVKAAYDAELIRIKKLQSI